MRYLLWLVFLFLAACATFRPPQEQVPQYAFPAADTGALADFARAATTTATQDESVFWLLSATLEALEARAAVIDSAVSSIDIQYFIWQGDLVSDLLLQRLLAAADRGVRVRLLVDDLSASGRDRQFYALTQHANIEVRSFNTFRARAMLTQAFEFIFRFRRLNNRMHLKTIIADGQVAMIGGRNIGDRYFGIYDRFIQDDVDIMFAGSLVGEAQRSFDLYWNSPLAVSTADYLRPRRRVSSDLADLRNMLEMSVQSGTDEFTEFAFEPMAWLNRNRNGASPSPAEFLFDEPNIDYENAERIKDELYEFLGSAQRELIIVSAYFIPDEAMLQLLEDARSRGVRIVLLTNSVQSNNHMLAHVAYRPFRKRVLLAGIELFETRPDAAILSEQAVSPAQPGYLGLHSKAAVVDGRHVMISTANLDPRSLDINMESAVLIEDVELAEKVRAIALEGIRPSNAWQLSLDDNGQLEWVNDSERRTSEPVRSPWQRMKQFLYTLLPVRDQA